MDPNSSTTFLNDKNLAIIIVTFEVFLNALRILSALLTFYFLYRFNSVTVVHGNLKLLVLFLPIAFTLASAAQVTDQFLLFFGGKQSNGIWLVIQLTGAFYGWAFLCCAFLPIFIFIERVIATLNKRTYEDFTRTIGICFVAANTMLSLLCVLIAVFGNCFLNNPHSLLHTPCWNLIFWTTFTLSSALCLMLNRYIACRNLRFESNEQSLAERFQSQENKNSINVLRPMIWFFLACSFASVVITAISMKFTAYQQLTLVISGILLTTMHLFAIFCALCKHPKLWKIVRRDLCFINRHQRRAVYATSLVTANNRVQLDTKNHFYALDKIWNEN